jgi:dephospho-CoA kinase
MIKFGLTGNICSGKSTAESILKELNIPLIDADDIVHDLLKNNKLIINKIIKEFKNFDIITNKIIDRQKLGNIVFKNPALKQKLENIIHPTVIKKINVFFKKNKNSKLAIASVPLLFEANLENLFDKIILITIDPKIQLNRLKNRNNISKKEAQLRIDSQLDQKIKFEKSDFIIDNSSSIENLKIHILSIFEKFMHNKY